ncbi:unnamed protein product [Linum tenue]|uniref:Uncharacterized protein n=1 Tax=Linum tenue TaxID=586396 RepID=A0AAV0QVY1_9ROSI|nr:unnamed protein product [Linum tenue]
MGKARQMRVIGTTAKAPQQLEYGTKTETNENRKGQAADTNSGLLIIARRPFRNIANSRVIFPNNGRAQRRSRNQRQLRRLLGIG